MKTLSKYENSVIEQYAVNGKLLNRAQREVVLDDVEAYISNNIQKLGIKSYERNKNSIVVTFSFGFTHVFSPLIDGYY